MTKKTKQMKDNHHFTHQQIIFQTLSLSSATASSLLCRADGNKYLATLMATGQENNISGVLEVPRALSCSSVSNGTSLV